PALAYTTEVGASRTVNLPDGSVVRLAPLSRIEVAPGYGRPDRAVALTGEAYFEVRHDAAHPFTVRTATAEVRDLGTTFSVAEGDSGGARVVVTAGSVSLRPSAGGDAVVLRAGDRGDVSAAGEVRVERGTAGEDDVAWTKGRLVFRDAPIPEVADALRRWYGITLVVRDPELARRHLTASFGTETADEAVQVVAAALGGQLQRRGDTASVVPPGGSP
ncbi:MAG: FecR family protein, partial [Longimicrobiaceae bacterium]